MLNADVKVIMIGVSYESCTALHLSEYLAPESTVSPQGAAIIQDGERIWSTFDMADVDSDIFPELGTAFEETNPGIALDGKLGQALCKIVPMKPLVDFGTIWVTERRKSEVVAE